ncbi:HNH endonuclease [Shewanella algae]|uniref:HNH endonuclease n=1 Tax=Shewanella algae TaxID=38313 RepID=UPI001AAD4930|nr:HNH endonuclease [Shewanella algae]MBO2650765.1 HNH endonuclease [Shewanella algae]
MIKLKKTIEPQVLTKNSRDWTDAFLKKLSAGELPTSTESSRYRHKEIKSALVEETHGKCAYCESKLQHIHHGDVEHIAPKSLHPAKRFEWNNLTLACEICNQNKSDRDPETENIIDPYVTDPADHLIFIGTFLFPLSTPTGKNTEVILDLNRAALLERRKARLEQIMGIFETILREDLPIMTRKIIYENLLKNECAASSEYSAMIKSIDSSMRGKIPEEILQ